MTTSRIRMATSLVAPTILAAVGAWCTIPVEESTCRPAVDLEAESSSGRTERVPSRLASNGELLRWDAGTGETLQLRLFAAEPGTYEVSLFAVHGPDGPEMSAKVWDDPLVRNGKTSFVLRRASEPAVAAIRFGPVSLGPGHQILEVSCLQPGEFLLDCVALRRTGDLVVPRAGDGAGGRPFLGVEMGEASAAGVVITRTVPGSGAAEAGLEAGDVLVSINGEPMDKRDRVVEAIVRNRPGDPIDLVLLRGDELLEKVARLGRRSESERSTGSRAAHVIDVLDVRPGQVIADIGTGSGWLAEALAKALDADGLVYAVEINEGHVRRLRLWPTPNLVPVLSLPDDISLPENSLDTAMLHDVASHVNRRARPRFYESVARALKPEGRLVIFDPHGGARAVLDELHEYGFVPVGAVEEGDLDEQLQNGIAFRYSGAGGE